LAAYSTSDSNRTSRPSWARGRCPKRSDWVSRRVAHSLRSAREYVALLNLFAIPGFASLHCDPADRRRAADLSLRIWVDVGRARARRVLSALEHALLDQVTVNLSYTDAGGP